MDTSFLFKLRDEDLLAIGIIVLHVFNYNITAHLEYHTRIFTKIIGKHAIYFYAVYLILSALVRDHFINISLMLNQNTIPWITEEVAKIVGMVLFVLGILLNLWTLKVLGIKVLDGCSMHLYFFSCLIIPLMCFFKVTGGPYQYFNDPQYVGTTLAMFGSAIYYRSYFGFVLTAVMGITFYLSVKFVEGPHMNRIYANKAASQNVKKKK